VKAPNQFYQDLAYSHDAGEDKIFESYYRNKFDRVDRIEKVTSLEQQKLGIDKVIYQSGGRWITVDEKKRREVQPDIAIEVVHCYKAPDATWRDKPRTLEDALSRQPTREGWVFKNNCDFLVYAFMPSSMLYLLPFKLLVVATRRNWMEWAKHPDVFKLIVSDKNPTYYSVSIGVPTDTLFAAIESEMIDSFETRAFVGPEGVRFFVEPSGQISFSVLRSLGARPKNPLDFPR